MNMLNKLGIFLYLKFMMDSLRKRIHSYIFRLLKNEMEVHKFIKWYNQQFS